jgi:hypothetical protein
MYTPEAILFLHAPFHHGDASTKFPPLLLAIPLSNPLINPKSYFVKVVLFHLFHYTCRYCYNYTVGLSNRFIAIA